MLINALALKGTGFYNVEVKLHWNIKKEGRSFAFPLTFSPQLPTMKLNEILG
jgi:hypothetical protein